MNQQYNKEDGNGMIDLSPSVIQSVDSVFVYKNREWNKLHMERIHMVIKDILC